ncbi:MAG TPA: hypothetical protein VJ916_08175 [Anaerovoracaceae bacterium]|nr:hypothetical protein [Anaerovoracaceae bacterium]
MEDIRILEIARSYLGSNSIMDEVTEKKINVLLNDIKSTVIPRYVYNIYDISINSDVISFKDTVLKIKSKDLSDLLKSSPKCIIIACTLGNYVENKLRHFSKYSVSDGLIYDALAAAYIEEFLNDLNNELEKDYEHLTMRYSPGYGDLKLEVQPILLNLLHAQKRIGLTATEEYLLIPRKSITAFIGIQNTPWVDAKILCDTCKLKDVCELRKEGKFCGARKNIK